jgi:hypothetical protein
MHEYEFVGIQPGGLSEIVGVGYPLQQIVGAGQVGYNRPRAGLRGMVAAWPAFAGADPTADASLSGPTAQAVGPQVVNVQPRNVREFAIGFGPTSPAVNPNQTVIVAAQPQIIFRGSRLVVPSVFGTSTVAANFTINDIRVGKDSQFVSAGPLPAIAYLENAVGTAMGLDTCNVGQLITLNVTNVGAAAEVFIATVFGTSVQ